MANIVVGIDTGGTFTDGFFWDERLIRRAKVDTTPHDLTVCFLKCLEEGGAAFGYGSLADFLKNVQIIMFSSTVATNTFVEQNGSKVGMLVTKGFEDSLYRRPGMPRLPDFLLNTRLAVGVEEEVSASGQVVKPIEEEKLLQATKTLLDRGAQFIVLSLRNSHLNPANELQARQILGAYYPRHYLGSLPVIVASQFCSRPADHERTNLSILNAYIHQKLAGTLYKAEDKLRDLGYHRPFLAVGSNGGCTRVAKTRAIDTVGSSPVAGYLGSFYWTKKYQISNVITIDVGGTSLDAGIIANSKMSYGQGKLFGAEVGVPLIDVSSIALGGGSIARVDPKARTIELGPDSAGAMPGPACFDLGGESPTLTDADVVLNRIDPGYFLGGRRKLNRDAAVESLKQIAAPLGLTTEKAAMLVADRAAEMGAEYLRQLISTSGVNPAEFTLFAYGGAGACHCCDIAERLGISRVYVFPFSSTFGAFGASIMDVMHVYMHAVKVPLREGGKTTLRRDDFNKIVREEQTKATRDMSGEGFTSDQIHWSVELEVQDQRAPEGEELLLFVSPRVSLDSDDDGKQVWKAYKEESERLGVSTTRANVSLKIFHVKSACSLFKYDFPEQSPVGGDPTHALKSQRDVITREGVQRTPVYNAETMACGNRIVGPAILESSDTTAFLPAGWSYTVDRFLNAILVREPRT